MEKIDLENFGPKYRDRIIGHSLYRICRLPNSKWYICEIFNDGESLAIGKSFYSYDLKEAIRIMNSFKGEKEVINAHCKVAKQ